MHSYQPLFQNTLKYATTQPYGKVYFFEADQIKFLTVKQSEGSQANFHPPPQNQYPWTDQYKILYSFFCKVK